MSASNELLQVVKETRRFSKKEFGESALDWDLDPNPGAVKELWKKATELDLPVMTLPEEAGGAGYGADCGALVLETMAGMCPGLASIMAHHYVGVFAACAGSKKQIKKYVDTTEGAATPGAWGVIFDDEARLSVSSNGKNYFVNGTSSLTANALYADYLSVFVPTKEGNITCFVVETESSGICLGPDPEIPGLTMNPFRPIVFEKVKVPVDNVIGTPGEAGGMMDKAKDLLFQYTAAMALGAAKSAYDQALAYARERYQFGKTIIQHQEVRRILGAMQMKLQAGSAMLYSSFQQDGDLFTFGNPNPSVIKAFCTEAAFEVVVDAVQVHGGYGYMHEQGMEKLMRDVKVLQVLGGSNPQHLVDSLE